MARQPATTTTTINGLIELTEHFVIFPSSIVILYQPWYQPSFSINIRGGHRANFAINTRAFVSQPRYKNIAEEMRDRTRELPLETVRVGSDAFQSRRRRNNCLEERSKQRNLEERIIMKHDNDFFFTVK